MMLRLIKAINQTTMKLIPYVEFTKLETQNADSNQWYYMSHLSNACAAEDSHRTSAYAICLLSEGELLVESDLFFRKAQAPAIITIGPSSIRKFTDLGAAYDARILFFRKEVFMEGQADINYLDKFGFFEETARQVVDLNSKQYQTFTTYFDLVLSKSQDGAMHTSEIIRSLIYIVLNEIEEVHESSQPDSFPVTDKGMHMLSEFKRLLAQYFIDERQVSFYAEKMNLTPKYFSSIIKEVSGKTAGAWINEMLLLESKVRLQNKAQSIAQIAFELNFSDPSHFGKFFKKHAGVSPLEYRR